MSKGNREEWVKLLTLSNRLQGTLIQRFFALSGVRCNLYSPSGEKDHRERVNLFVTREDLREAIRLLSLENKT